jgi:hypothetical protein
MKRGKEIHFHSWEHLSPKADDAVDVPWEQSLSLAGSGCTNTELLPDWRQVVMCPQTTLVFFL